MRHDVRHGAAALGDHHALLALLALVVILSVPACRGVMAKITDLLSVLGDFLIWENAINQGPANLAYVINALTAAFPGCEIETLDVRFLDNAFAGDVVEASGKVVEVSAAGGRRRTICEVWLHAPGPRPVVGGRAVVSQPV